MLEITLGFIIGFIAGVIACFVFIITAAKWYAMKYDKQEVKLF